MKFMFIVQKGNSICMWYMKNSDFDTCTPVMFWGRNCYNYMLSFFNPI